MHAQVMELVVRGRLGAELIAALDGFDVATDAHGLTHIVGRIADQARLLGVLEMFDGLHIEVVSVNPVMPTQVPHSGEADDVQPRGGGSPG
jgi:hypothetical protein